MENKSEDTENPKMSKKNHLFKIVFFLLLIVGLYFFVNSPIFDIQTITIKGNKTLPSKDIQRLSQVSQGDNLFKIKKNEVVKNILVHPLIKKVEISRDLPSTLRIDISERKLIGLLVCKDGFIKVSEKGYFISIHDDLGDYQLPIITGVSMDQLPGPGQIIKKEGLQIALDILSNIESDLLENIAEINVADSNDILAYTVQGIEIKLGSKDEVEGKLENIQVILDKIINLVIDEDEIEYIDLRFSGPPIIKKK